MRSSCNRPQIHTTSGWLHFLLNYVGSHTQTHQRGGTKRCFIKTHYNFISNAVFFVVFNGTFLIEYFEDMREKETSSYLTTHSCHSLTTWKRWIKNPGQDIRKTARRGSFSALQMKNMPVDAFTVMYQFMDLSCDAVWGKKFTCFPTCTVYTYVS